MVVAIMTNGILNLFRIVGVLLFMYFFTVLFQLESTAFFIIGIMVFAAFVDAMRKGNVTEESKEENEQ